MHSGMTALFIPHAPLYTLPHGPALRPPLRTHALRSGADGEKGIRLTWRRDARYAQQTKGKAILARFERLIIMQLDVGEGEKPRTVQQLVASRRVLVVNGRYRLPGG